MSLSTSGATVMFLKKYKSAKRKLKINGRQQKRNV